MHSFRLSWMFVTCLWLLQGCSLVASAVKRYKWQIDYQFWSPDCVEKLIISINGEHPGPTILANSGDTVIVEVENLMPTEGVVIHWHGIVQKGTPWYDGVAGVSQCAINPGETFTYEFKVEKAGTYFYHGHYGLHLSAGLFGFLIVDQSPGVKEPFEYDGEFSVLLGDWWHMSVFDQLLGLQSNPFRWVGEPQAITMNGRGMYNCSLAAAKGQKCNASNPQCAPLVLQVEAGKTYRLRIASAAALSALNFQIEGHTMRVVEADANYVEEVELMNLNVYSGQSYSVLVTAKPNVRQSFWITANVFAREPQTPPALAILAYTPTPPGSSPQIPSTVPPDLPFEWNDSAYTVTQSRLIVARKEYNVPPPSKTDEQIILLNTQNTAAGGIIRWAVNNYSLSIPATPFLPALKHRLASLNPTPPPHSYSPGYDIYSPPQYPNTNLASLVYQLPLNSTIDFVLQNANTLTVNTSEIHPWHMHGHYFWVLGFGDGVYNPGRDIQRLNLVNPPLRNTVPLHAYGWTAVRFIPDNPGAWLFHCHLEAHLAMGMGIVFSEGIAKLGRPPRSILGCGKTKKWLP